MRANKVKALMRRDMSIFRRSKWRFVQFLYFPVTTVIIWGLFALSTQNFSPETGLMVLGVNVFWSFSFLAQSTTNNQMNEDYYSGSFKQVISSGISEFEYVFARLISSSIISILIMFLMIGTALFFGLTIFVLKPLEIFLLASISLLGSIALSILVAGMIMFFGREYHFLAWTILQLFILLSAPLYPLEILPEALAYIAMVMPFTNIFMGIRELISTGAISSMLFVNAFGIVAVYLLVSIPIYYYAFKRARRNGMLAGLH